MFLSGNDRFYAVLKWARQLVVIQFFSKDSLTIKDYRFSFEAMLNLKIAFFSHFVLHDILVGLHKVFKV